jgi:putative MATE family efflux protein
MTFMTHDMTKGPLLPQLIGFTIPLILGNFLQLTYNAVDSIILGRFVSAGALAAAGTCNPLMTLIIMAMQGMTMGAGILIGNLYGAGQTDKLKRQVSTAMISGSVFSVAVSVLIMIFAGELLGLLRVDPLIMDLCLLYLRIVACGLIFNFIYNFFAAVMRAMGDSRSPLIFLGSSALVNIGGDLFFVIVLNLGTLGCAVSTVFSEGLSCLLCWIFIKRHIPVLDMGRQWLVFDQSLLARTLRYGSVSALQQSAVQLGIVSVQGMVNSMGYIATAAFAAAGRIDSFVLIPERNISNAMTNVMAQNMGAGEKKRVRDTFRIGLGLDLVYAVVTGILLFAFCRPAMGLFTGEEEVIGLGVVYLRLIALMYILPAVTNCVQGYFRGVGDLRITLVSTLLNMGSRVAVCFFLVARTSLGIASVPWACLAGWVAMTVYEAPFLILLERKLKGE